MAQAQLVRLLDFEFAYPNQLLAAASLVATTFAAAMEMESLAIAPAMLVYSNDMGISVI